MKINEDLQLPSLDKSLFNAIIDATEIDSTGSNANGYWLKFKNGVPSFANGKVASPLFPFQFSFTKRFPHTIIIFPILK